MAFSPDGTTLAAAFEDGTVKLRDPTSGEERTVLRHAGPVKSVAYAPDGRTLAAGCEDGTVTLWDPGSGKARQVFKTNGCGITSVAYAPDGRTLAVAAGRDVTLRDAPAVR